VGPDSMPKSGMSTGLKTTPDQGDSRSVGAEQNSTISPPVHLPPLEEKGSCTVRTVYTSPNCESEFVMCSLGLERLYHPLHHPPALPRPPSFSKANIAYFKICELHSRSNNGHCIRSVAGFWLFSGRRWRNPQNRKDREALVAGYDSLVETFPVFSLCSRHFFFSTISSFCASWYRSTHNNLHDLSDSSSTSIDDEPPPWHDDDDGSSGPRLESGAAALRAQRRLAKGVSHQQRLGGASSPTSSDQGQRRLTAESALQSLGFPANDSRITNTSPCDQRPPLHGLTGHTLITTGLTDEDTCSSDSYELTPLSGAEAWGRCRRLAPQGSYWAAGFGAEAGAAGPEGRADVDRDRGWGGDEAAAGTGVLGEAKSESERARNAGDSVDMALYELSMRCAANQPPGWLARRDSLAGGSAMLCSVLRPTSAHEYGLACLESDRKGKGALALGAVGGMDWSIDGAGLGSRTEGQQRGRACGFARCWGHGWAS
jgi:hypothetical protein